MTFLDGLTARGGGLNALLRHAVAAFLNASHPDADLGITSSQVGRSPSTGQRAG